MAESGIKVKSGGGVSSYYCLLFMPFGGQVAMSTIPFALPHFPAGVTSGIAAGVAGGFYFAFTYVHWRGSSRWTTFWTTCQPFSF